MNDPSLWMQTIEGDDAPNIWEPEVENKQLSLWDLGLLEMYGKNNN